MAAQDRIEPPATSADRGFRADINGLRAVSVLAVVAYHFDRGLASGGFFGVDVFFVISGFLMTNIIVGRLRRGAFGLWGFYGDRARRIAPALVAMCALATVLGAVALDPWTYQRFTNNIPETLLFVSNFVFAGGGGYFAPVAEPEWLLHTWSLAVEWQFYLTYPLVLLWVWSVPALRRWLGPLLIAGLIGSFALGQAVRSAWAFYLEPARAWELLAGGLCAYYGPALRLGVWARRGAHAAGLALIGFSLIVLGAALSWPSPWAALPVAGAALVVLADVKDAAWARLPGVGLIGRSSYSTYIWHWPMILAMRYAGLAFTPLVIAAGVAACLAAGLASHWLIERRLTAALVGLSGPMRWTVALASLAAVAGLAAGATATHGFEALRTAGLPPAVRAALADDRAARRDWAFEAECGPMAQEGGVSLCRLGDPAARSALVIGDSYAAMIAARYAHPPAGPGSGVTFLTRGGCAPFPGLGLGKDASRCVAWTDLAWRYAERSPYRRIVIIAAWPAYRREADAVFQRLAAQVQRLTAAGKQVVVIGPLPNRIEADPMLLYRRTFWTGNTAAPPFARSEFEAATASVRRRLTALAARTRAIYVEPLDALCPQGLCPVETNGRAVYKDGRHFRPWAMADPRFAVLDPWLDPPAGVAAGPKPP